MSRDWDESRWMCAAAVAPKKFLKTASSAGSNSSQPEPSCVPPSIECAKTSKRLKPEKWRTAFDKEGRAVGFQKVLKAVVSGGVDHSIRAEVWEFLLGCYAVGTTFDHRQQLRQARRERYKELIEQCQLMHGSVGSGKLAYTVGSKIMDVRNMSKDAARKEAKETVSKVRQRSSEDGRTPWSINELERFEDSRETFEDAEDMPEDMPTKSVPNVATPVLGSDEGSDSGASEGEADISFSNDGENNPDYLRLPVRTLFPKYVMGRDETNEKDRGSSTIVVSRKSNCSRQEIDAEDHITFNRPEMARGKRDELDIMGDAQNLEDVETTSRPDKAKTNKTEKFGVQDHDRTKDVENESKATGVAPNGVDINEEKMAEWLWTLHRIVVDVVRTDRHLKFYEDSKNMARMSDILAVYAWVDPATGYCQGMSDLLSPFILLYEDDADAFWCFESLLRRVRQNFQMEGPVGVMRQLQALTNILELTDVSVFRHLVHIGADSFLFAFRMLLVLFRRELSFGEALCMWEMMWAADFDHEISWALEYNCPEALIIKQPSTFPQDESVSEDNNSYIESGQKPMSPFYSFQEQSFDTSPPEEDNVGYLSKSPLCGLRAGNFWPRHSRHRVRTVSSLLRKAGDDELSVFVVAAVLVLNRTKFIKDVQSMDDAIKAFNEIQMEIKVRSCIRTAIKLRKKYQRRLVRRAALERRGSASQ